MQNIYRRTIKISFKSFAFLAVFLATSCATLFSNKNQSMSFDSNEKGVEIYINSELKCTTPCMMKVRRSRDSLLVVAKKDGFDDRSMIINAGINIVSLINLTSITGFSTDITTEKMWEYQPNAYYITMDKEVATPKEKKQREQEYAIRKFILENYSDLYADTNSSSKEYLRSLSSMTGFSIGQLEGMIRNSLSEADLANNIIKEYRKK